MVCYPCDPCDYKATVKSNLRIHVDSIHVEVIYPFDQCDYKATQKDDLKKHFESIHKGVIILVISVSTKPKESIFVISVITKLLLKVN